MRGLRTCLSIFIWVVFLNLPALNNVCYGALSILDEDSDLDLTGVFDYVVGVGDRMGYCPLSVSDGSGTQIFEGDIDADGPYPPGPDEFIEGYAINMQHAWNTHRPSGSGLSNHLKDVLYCWGYKDANGGGAELEIDMDVTSGCEYKLQLAWQYNWTDGRNYIFDVYVEGIKVLDDLCPEVDIVGMGSTLDVNAVMYTYKFTAGDNNLDVNITYAGHSNKANDWIAFLNLLTLEKIQPGTSTPNPDKDETDVAIDANLSWVGEENPDSYDVYFGTDETAVTNATTASYEFKVNQTALTFDPGTMKYNATYYWRVDAVKAGTAYTGSVWDFSTVLLKTKNPSPDNGEAVNYNEAYLTWDDELGADSYNVYFGTDNTAVAGAVYFRGDFDNSGQVDLGDIIELDQYWLGVEAAYDLNHDGFIDLGDLVMVADDWLELNVYNEVCMANRIEANYAPGILAKGTTYYWRIDAVANGTAYTGDVWNFETEDDLMSISLLDEDSDLDMSGDFDYLVSVGDREARCPLTVSSKTFEGDIDADGPYPPEPNGFITGYAINYQGAWDLARPTGGALSDNLKDVLRSWGYKDVNGGSNKLEIDMDVTLGYTYKLQIAWAYEYTDGRDYIFDVYVDGTRVFDDLCPEVDIQDMGGSLEINALMGTYEFVAYDDNLDVDIVYAGHSNKDDDWYAFANLLTLELTGTCIPLVINEFMASNTTTLLDEDGDSSDWIEIYNPTATTLILTGCYLTDDSGDLTKWRFPDGQIIAADEYLIVFASGKDRRVLGSELHTNFQLAADGEYLALVAPDGVTVVHEYAPYPSQLADISYGLVDIVTGICQYMVIPTPGAANIGGQYKVADTKFSVDRGFYDTPFDVEITTATVGATIKYTTDGSAPSESNGLTYTAPISVSSTTTLRAMAYRAGWLSTNVDTQTYIFVADVIKQPEMWDYITQHTTWGPQLEQALLDLPSISLVAPDFDPMNTDCDVPDAEKETSIELIFPNGGNGFQVNAAIECFGGSSMHLGKASLRISLKSMYGPSKLRYDLFGDCEYGGRSATEEFDQILLRSGLTDSLFFTNPSPGGGTYIRNRWACDRQLEMGQPAPRGRFVHLYFNGTYWGQYHLMERPNDQFMEAYYGGDSDDYDVYKGDWIWGPEGPLVLVSGTMDAWNDMLACANDYNAIQQYIDMENYIDYMLLNFYGGNSWDWSPNHNWMVARRRQAGAGAKFFCWDSDMILSTGLYTNVLDNILDAHEGGPGEMWDDMSLHAEVKLMTGDLAQKYFFNNGILTADRVIAQIDALAAEIQNSIIAECARWGDLSDGADPGGNDYTPDTWYGDWTVMDGLDWIKAGIVKPATGDNRTDVVIQQLRAEGLFPSIDAPIFYINVSYQHGGQITGTDSLSMTAAAGAIYYTLDDTEPKLSVGDFDIFDFVTEDATKYALVPGSDIGSDWRTNYSYNVSGWSVGTVGAGYERNTAYDSFFDIDVESEMYGVGGSKTCYVRIPFIISADDLNETTSLDLFVRYDDGFAAYINGVRVESQNAPGEPISWDERSSGPHEASANWDVFSITGHLSDLQAGDNLLAIHALNTSNGSSHFLISAKLVASNLTGGGGYTVPFTLSKSAIVKARAKDGATWSALNEATYAVGPIVDDLRITEIMYHPTDATQHEKDAAGNPNIVDEDFEFVELKNTGAEVLNLNLVSFIDGIDFTFGDVTVAPGEYVLVVSDPNAFNARYPDFTGIIVGQYTGRLNNNGEKVRLRDAIDTKILTFDYSDGWYDITDGMGFSLTIKDPDSSDPNDWDEKAGWRPSAAIGGSPGWDDTGDVPVLGSIKINEILAHSDGDPNDWIELHNTTDALINIGGWFLSDSDGDFTKYEIAAGTSIPAHGYIVFTQEGHFGNVSDPGCNVPFALSENGETLYLHSGQDGVITGYSEEEDFGASQVNVAFGRYEKSTNTFNFVAMATNTPGSVYQGAANSDPKVGPIVINEIMYYPYPEIDAEYIELLNTSGSPETLYLNGVPWKITDGVDYTFPSGSPVTLAAGEYFLLVKNLAEFTGKYGAPVCGYAVWTDGSLSNGGERLEISMPGDLDGIERMYIRIDRVNYDDEAGWPTAPDGDNGDSTSSLSRIVPSNYGNDVINWEANAPSPGVVNP